MSARPSILIGMGLQKKPSSPLPPARNSMPAQPKPMGQDPMKSQSGMGQKATPEDAGFIPASQKCGACANYEKSTKDCTKVDGQIEAMDSCSKFFQEASGGSNSMPSDNDGDEAISNLGGQ